MKVINTDNIVTKKSNYSGEKKSKEEVLQILQDSLVPVCDKASDRVLDSSKYVRLAKDFNYRNYRLCTYKDIKELGLESSFTAYQKQFFAECGASIAIFNELSGKPVSIVFRSVTGKSFMDYSLTYSLYGYDMIPEDFKYGDYLIITEGIYDADSIRQINPNAVAMLTSNITVMQAEILKTLTDKFIIAFDSDDAGESGFKTALNRLGTDIKRLRVYPGDKDLGVLEEMKYKNTFEYKERLEYYKKEIEESKTGLGFSL